MSAASDVPVMLAVTRPMLLVRAGLSITGFPAGTRNRRVIWRIRQDLNLQPSDPKSEALSN
jgi:hypothetical protein